MDGYAPELWMHPALRAAVLASDFGTLLRTWRKLSGMSQTLLGERIGLAQPEVSDIERGRRQVRSAEVRDRILDGLEVPADLRAGNGTPPEPVRPVPAMRLPSLAPDSDLLNRVTGVIAGTARADGITVEWLERLLAEHRRIEDSTGSRPIVGIMRHQLDAVVALQRHAAGADAERLVRLAAEHAQFLGWLAQDQNDLASALLWYDRSHDWALEAGDVDMASTALSMRAHLAWSSGQGKRCTALAEAARWSAPGTSLGVQGQAVQMAARGHAIRAPEAGDGDAHRHADAARRLLDESEGLVRRADEQRDGPSWMYYYDATWFTLQRGMTESHLGNWGRAVELLGRGLDVLPTGYRRDRAWYGACLARALAGSGGEEEALRTATGIIPDAAAVGRPHAWGELHRVAALMLRRRMPEARALVDMLRVYD